MLLKLQMGWFASMLKTIVLYCAKVEVLCNRKYLKSELETILMLDANSANFLDF